MSKYILLSDISDVIIMNNPLELNNLDKDNLYCCVENETFSKNKWYCNYVKSMKFLENDKLLLDYKDIMKDDNIILNCGVIFCKDTLMVELLDKMIYLFMYIYEKYKIYKPLDMFVFNYCVYKYFRKNLIIDSNFTTKFGHNIYDTSKIVKHK
jgi:hypothetical protein